MTDKMMIKHGRMLLKGNYTRAISIMLFCLAELIIFSLLPIGLIKLAEISGLKAIIDGISLIIFPTVTAFISVLISFRAFCVFSSASLGGKAWYSGRAIGIKSSSKRLIYWFQPKKSFKALRLTSLIFLLKSLWTVALLSPSAMLLAAIIGTAFYGGIEIYLLLSLASGFAVTLIIGLIFRFIIVQRYFLAPYLMVKNPRLNVLQAVKQSKNLLEGHIFEIVKFKIKYIPSFLLYPLIIPVIFLHPQYKQGCSVIAKEICL